MAADKELSRARKAIARGRGDEALVVLWNLVEQARLENDHRTLTTIAELAGDIAQTDEGSRREAERLLETLGRQPASTRTEPVPAGLPSAGSEEPSDDEEPSFENWMPDDSEFSVERDSEGGLGQVPGELEDQGGIEEEPRRRSRARYVIPAVTILAILLNLLARALGD
jgi:hypothetical protein